MEDFIQLGEEYRVTSDGRMNLILHEKYEKMEGRGKSAVPTGEFDYKWCGYFRGLDHLGSYLVDSTVYKYVGSGLEETVDKVEKLRDEIVEVMGKIDVTWAK